MTADSILLANNGRIATQSRTQGGNIVHDQVVVTQLALDDGVAADKALFKYLATDAPSIEMAVNAAGGVAYEYVVPTGKVALIAECNISIIDDGPPTISEFGGIAALTNGVLVKALETDDTDLVDFLDGQPIKTNGGFGILAGNDIGFYTGVGDDGVLISWDITKAMRGEPLKLTAGQKFRVTLQDDLSTLVQMRWMIQGTLVDAT